MFHHLLYWASETTLQLEYKIGPTIYQNGCFPSLPLSHMHHLICTISTIFISLFFGTTRGKSRHPPTPFSLPVIGHLHLLSPIPHQAFHNLSLKYGPVFRLFMGSIPCVIASSPETAKEFLITNENSFLNRPQNSAIEYLTYGSLDFAFTPYGPYWKFMKKIVMSQLLNGTTLDMFRSVRHDEVNRFMNSLYANAKSGIAVNLGEELAKTTNNMMSRMIMNERCSDIESKASDMRKLVAEINEMADRFNLSDYIWFLRKVDFQRYGKKLKGLRTRFDVMMDRIIKDHETERKRGTRERDLLDVLLDIAQDKSMEIELTNDHIKALIMNLFTAGTDTSALTIEWALSELINHPNIMKKAAQEIDQVVGKTRLLQESDIPNLPYLQAIVKETLRLHSAVPLIPRQSTEDCTVAGYHIRAKTYIFINVWALARDPKSWENPLEFRPERFQETRLDVRGQKFDMLPFGSGKRICPGISLSMHAVQTTLGSMIQCFEWKGGKDGNLASVDMEEALSLTLSRANRLVCVPVARLDSIPLAI